MIFRVSTYVHIFPLAFNQCCCCQDARHDEMARKAYKLLAALHSECGDIIKIATEIGTVQREARNLEDQIEVEMAKGTAAKLERVLADIEQVEKETALLLEKQ